MMSVKDQINILIEELYEEEEEEKDKSKHLKNINGIPKICKIDYNKDLGRQLKTIEEKQENKIETSRDIGVTIVINFV